MKLIYQVRMADHGRRAMDVLISGTGMSRTMCKRIRLYGRLIRNNLPCRMIDPVYEGDLLTADDRPDKEPSPALRVPTGIHVYYQDDWLAVLGKPPGLVTHPSYFKEERALTSLLSDSALHPVSRLDRDTSGIVLIARNSHAHHVLTCHPIRKFYLAAVHGRFPALSGLVQAPVRRSSQSIVRREIHPEGAQAKTIWRELHYFENAGISLVRFELLTGRTHQIRLHSLSAGCALIGETLYKSTSHATTAARDYFDTLIGRQALHASAILFRHPVSGQTMRFTGRLPEDFRCLLAELYRMEKGQDVPF